MRTILFILTVTCVISLAFWAYRENYATKASLDRTDALHRDIRTAHARLAVLKAEWAYLNRPDRLRDLAELNFDRLGLLPLTPAQFGLIDQVAYPAPKIPLIDISRGVDVSSREAGE
ncbi:MAG: cell division protein FtsL [Pseudomonadota bacterium]